MNELRLGVLGVDIFEQVSSRKKAQGVEQELCKMSFWPPTV